MGTPDFNKNHPERTDDEVFLTNANNEVYAKIDWATKRAGNTAYSPEGSPLGNAWPGAFPVFAKQKEIRNKYPEIADKLSP